MTSVSGGRASRPGPRELGLGTGKSVLVALPMLLLTAFMMIGASGGLPRPMSHRLPLLGALVAVNLLFFLMVRTGRTDRYRVILFAAVAVTFSVSFISNMIEMRGSMAVTEEESLRGRTPMCHIAIPMLIIPAALTRTIIFPGTMLGRYAEIASMIVIWLGATIALGRGFCSWGCFFGGLEDGLSRLRRRPLLRRIGERWTYLPYAVLAAIVLVSAIALYPVYCFWICPFKAVSEYAAVTDFRTALQFVIFASIFATLVVVLPILTKRRTQCGLFCPMGAFQGLFNKLNVFEIRMDRESCRKCTLCTVTCPTFSVSEASLARGGTRLSCNRCGKCVDECPKGAARFHLKGTPPLAGARTARLLFLYPAFLFLVTFNGNAMVDAMRRLVLLATTGSMLR